jgi:anti-anti-sigma regulatory factor
LLRISTSDSAKDEVTLHIEGDVTNPSSGELERVVTALVSEGKRVVLELSGVRFVDVHGVDLLHRWRKLVALRDCTPFVNELLKARRSQSE